MPRRRLTALVFAALALTLIVPAQPALGARGMDLAVQEDSVFVEQLPNHHLRVSPREKGLELASRLHASWIRANVLWSYVTSSVARHRKAPRNIPYNWGPYDALIDGAAARGIRVQLSLSGPAPAWATANHRVGTYKPKVGPYVAFVRAAVNHFRGRVTRFSIWNEPNYYSWLTPLGPAPRIYRALYSRGYAAIKQIDPSAQVLFGETSANDSRGHATAPLKFLREVLCANASYHRARRCTPLKTDGYAQHPYDLWHKPTYQYPGSDNVTLATIGRLTRALSKLHAAHLLTTPSGGTPYVYVTEYGYLSGATAHRVSARTQGRYLVQAFQMGQRNPRIKEMLQYLLIATPPTYTFFDTSIAARNGSVSLAFKMLAAWAARAARAGKISTAKPPHQQAGGGSPPQGGGSSPPPSTPPPGGGCPVASPLPVCP